MTNFPNHIKFLSDESEAEFILEVEGAQKNGKGERTAIYKFIKAKENLGRQFPMFFKDIERLKKCGLLAITAPNLADN